MAVTVATVKSASAFAVRGQNHRARLVLTPEDAAGHNPFLLMVEDWFAPPAGFPTHPHRGMETVTFVLEGHLVHEDHTGGRGRLGAGGVAFMTAGAGVLHSEMPGPQGVRLLQLWLNLPARLKFTPARYADLDAAAVPEHREPGVCARVCAGSLGAVHVPHGSTWPLTLIDLRLDAGCRFEMPLPAGTRAFAYVIEGAAALSNEGRAVSAGDVAWLSVAPPPELPSLRIAARDATRLLVWASPVIDEPIAFGGPFVMNTEQEIAQAFADLRAGRLTTATAARA